MSDAPRTDAEAYESDGGGWVVDVTFAQQLERELTPSVHKSFETWWDNEGSAMRPLPNEDAEAHVHRITAIAWANGAYCATPAPSPSDWRNFNVNQYVMVKLTDRGREIRRRIETELLGKTPGWTYKARAEDENGWSKWLLWDLMATFGGFISMASMPPFETEIRIKQ